jgi:vanillate monooxygenase ferredoxin subunit
MMDTIAVKVARKTQEALDVCSFELVRADGGALPAFSAGAHIDVHLGDSLLRQYSLCNNDAETDRYLIGVLRDPASRGGSATLHDRVREGDILQIGAPRNQFRLEPASKCLLFAGGIGITPILCMAERLARQSADFAMHYCTRSRERTAFYSYLKSSGYANKVEFHFDAGSDADKLDVAGVLAQQPEDTHLYVCGPGGFIEFIKSAAMAAGWQSGRVHFEYFGAAPVAVDGDASFQIQLARSGREFEVPANRTVLQVLLENGIDIPVSCEQGICGTCATAVLSGIPDHRDMYFNEAEHARNDQFTPCCSRAKSPALLLDL